MIETKPSLKRVKVKVCGMTRLEDVHAAVSLGVDAIGVILHASSPRLISLDQAKAIRDIVPAFISMVGVFVDCTVEDIHQFDTQIGLDLIQLHGAESNDFAEALARPYIKAIRAQSKPQVNQALQQHPAARAILVDPYVAGQHGGTGQSLDYDYWPDQSVSENKLILAGGLSPQNIRSRVLQFKPYAVDLNSGVEDAPGIKNRARIKAALTALER